MNQTITKIWNVVATIQGTVEPDRYVILGNVCFDQTFFFLFFFLDICIYFYNDLQRVVSIVMHGYLVLVILTLEL